MGNGDGRIPYGGVRGQIVIGFGIRGVRLGIGGTCIGIGRRSRVAILFRGHHGEQRVHRHGVVLLVVWWCQECGVGVGVLVPDFPLLSWVLLPLPPAPGEK